MIVAATNPLAVNATFIVEIVVFLALLWLLRRYVFPPLNNALKARQALIAQSLSEAEEARKEAERARTAERDELRLKGEQEQQAMLERARAELAREREQAVLELRRQVADLVLRATTKVLQEELNPTRQRKLIDQALKEVDLSA